MFKIHKEEIEINGKKITLETGKIARQADGAIIATCGETVVIATAVGAKKLKDDLIIIPVTEDGSYGEEGYVTDVLEKLLEKNTCDAIYTCGPELMMYKTVKLANEKGIFVQASLERMMKCGVGICGSCCVNEDLVCRDGTVFDGQHLAKNSEFGHFQRTKSGILEKI